jgi:hypothetical protein
MQQPDYLVLPATQSKLTVAIASASTTAAALPGKPGQLVLVSTDTDCFVNIGTSGLAAASSSVYSVFLPAGTVFVLRVTADHTHVRAIRDTADGFLSFTLMGDF